MENLFNDTGLKEVVEQITTPAYVYNLNALREQVVRFRSVFPREQFSLLFATMANPLPAILKALAEQGVGACVNSLLHIQTALDQGMPPSLIQYTATGTGTREMEVLIAKSVRTNLDSAQQLDRWFQLGGQKAGVRVNTASLLKSSTEEADRIGVHADELDNLIRSAKRNGGVIEGLHIYVGTNFPSPALMVPALDAFFKAAERVPDIEYVNIGGGVGVDYAHTGQSFALADFGAAVTEMHDRLMRKKGRNVHLFFEPGRSFIASSGVFLTRVTDVKSLYNKTYVAVDGSVATFPRPLHNPETLHRVRQLGLGGVGSQHSATIVGHTTFSKDILGYCEVKRDISEGDILVFYDAGAYCSSMASRFLGQRDPVEIFIG